MSSKELNECTSSCLLFYQRTSYISRTWIVLFSHCFSFVEHTSSDPIMYPMLFLLSLSFVRSFVCLISFELYFEMKFHIYVTHCLVILLRIYSFTIYRSPMFVLDLEMWSNFFRKVMLLFDVDSINNHQRLPCYSCQYLHCFIIHFNRQSNRWYQCLSSMSNRSNEMDIPIDSSMVSIK